MGPVALHSMTDSWSLAFVIDAAIVVGAIGIGGLVLGAQWHNAVREKKGLGPRRIGWGSRIGLGFLIPTAFVCLVEASITTEPTSDRTTAGVLGGISVVLIAGAVTGRTTATTRRLRATLPASAGPRRWALGLLAVSAFLGFMSAGGYDSVTSLRHHGVAVTAHVADITTYKATADYFLEYKLPSGRTVHCSTEDVLGEPNVGDHIRVLYDSTDPTANCQSLDYGTGYGEVWMFGGAAVITLLVGMMLWWVNRSSYPVAQRDVTGRLRA